MAYIEIGFFADSLGLTVQCGVILPDAKREEGTRYPTLWLRHGAGDDHNLPGVGTIDWKRIVPILLNAPRLQSIQSEVLTARRSTPIRTVAENIRRLFGELPTE